MDQHQIIRQARQAYGQCAGHDIQCCIRFVSRKHTTDLQGFQFLIGDEDMAVTMAIEGIHDLGERRVVEHELISEPGGDSSRIEGRWRGDTLG